MCASRFRDKQLQGGGRDQARHEMVLLVAYFPFNVWHC